MEDWSCGIQVGRSQCRVWMRMGRILYTVILMCRLDRTRKEHQSRLPKFCLVLANHSQLLYPLRLIHDKFRNLHKARSALYQVTSRLELRFPHTAKSPHLKVKARLRQQEVRLRACLLNHRVRAKAQFESVQIRPHPLRRRFPRSRCKVRAIILFQLRRANLQILYRLRMN